MSWRIELLQQGGIVRIVASGRMTLSDIDRSGKEAMELARTNGSHRYLADHRDAEFNLSTSDIYRLCNDMEMHFFDRNDRLAVVYGGPSAPREDYEFLETVAVNRGLPLRVYPDYDAAIAWLTANE